jgi:hypothetical protein
MKLRGMLKLKTIITYIYFQIPISHEAFATEISREGYYDTTKEYFWKLIITEDKKFSLLRRDYRINIKP